MSKKFIEAYKEIQKIDDQIEPYPDYVWTVFFDKSCAPSVSGNQVLMSPNADYKNIEDVRVALEYMVEQMGGKVKWK